MQPDDPGQNIVENHYHTGNGAAVNKLVWGVAAAVSLMLLTICGVGLAKLYDQDERLARVEALIEMLARRQ